VRYTLRHRNSLIWSVYYNDSRNRLKHFNRVD